MADPNVPAAIDIISGVHAQAADNAENLRALWLRTQADTVSAKYRDMLYETACMLHQAAGLLDALGTIIAAANRYNNLKSAAPTAVDWHEVPFPEPVAPAPALPAGGDAL